MMQLSGIFKLLKISRQGKDKNGNSYVHVSALSYSDEQFIMVKAFGSNADFIIRNLNGARRAYVAGTLVTAMYEQTTVGEMTLKLKSGQEVVKRGDVKVEALGLSLNVSNIQFLDKKSDNSADAEIDDDEIELSDEDLMDAEVSETVSGTIEVECDTDEEDEEPPFRMSDEPEEAPKTRKPRAPRKVK